MTEREFAARVSALSDDQLRFLVELTLRSGLLPIEAFRPEVPADPEEGVEMP